MQTRPSAADIRAWLVARITDVLEIPPDEIEIDAPIMNLALSSVEAVSLSGELEDYLGMSLSPTLIYQHSSLASLADYLAQA